MMVLIVLAVAFSPPLAAAKDLTTVSGAQMDHLDTAPAVVLAAFLPDGSRVSALEVRGASYTVYEQTFVTVGNTDIGMERKPVATGFGSISLDGSSSPDGYIGIALEDSTGKISGAQDAEMIPRQVTRLSTLDAAASYKNESHNFEYVQVASHLLCECSGELSVTATGLLKLRGFDVRVQDGSSTRTFETGVTRTEASATVRWIVLEMNGADVRLQSGEISVVFGPSTEVAWTGMLTVRGAVGAASINGRLYEPTDAIARIDGDLSATLTSLGTTLEISAIEGSLRSTNLRPAAASVAAPGAGDLGLLPVLAVGACVAGVGGGAYVWRRHGRPQRLQGYIERAAAAGDAGAIDDACRWYAKARRLARTDADLAMEHAWYLALAGDRRAALQAYEDAARLS
ncbi:MAG TPA: hypothetical protein VHH36_05265, partial [Candidatus Thermoplasmatota archaeon]|nr:hypothetical protein [Candidatus Thermoplasmatota archaeon]